jgi:hypothetical protein
VGYIVGLAKNSRVQAQATDLVAAARAGFAATGEKQRLFADLVYAAGSWDKPRRVIAKAEHGDLGSNPPAAAGGDQSRRGCPDALRRRVLCAGGDGKPDQGTATRSVCRPHELSSLVAQPTPAAVVQSLAYLLLEAIRRLALRGTELARAQCGTIRLKLLKIGAVVVRNTRRVRFILSSGYPLQALFFEVAARLAPG